MDVTIFLTLAGENKYTKFLHANFTLDWER